MGKHSDPPPAPAPPQVITPSPTQSMTEEQRVLSHDLGDMLISNIHNAQPYLSHPLNQLLPQNPNAQRVSFPQFDPQMHAQMVQQYQGPGFGPSIAATPWRYDPQRPIGNPFMPPSPGMGGGKPPRPSRFPSPGAGGGKQNLPPGAMT